MIDFRKFQFVVKFCFTTLLMGDLWRFDAQDSCSSKHNLRTSEQPITIWVTDALSTFSSNKGRAQMMNLMYIVKNKWCYHDSHICLVLTTASHSANAKAAPNIKYLSYSKAVSLHYSNCSSQVTRVTKHTSKSLNYPQSQDSCIKRYRLNTILKLMFQLKRAKKHNIAASGIKNHPTYFQSYN